MKNLWVSILFLFVYSVSWSQAELPENLKKQFYQAYLTSNSALWADGIQTLEQEYKANKTSFNLLNLAKAEYGIVPIFLAQKNKAAAKKHLSKAEDYLNKYLKDNELAEAHAILGGIYGMQIGFSPLKGMWLGPKSNAQLKKAMELDKGDPRTWYQHASSYLFSPAMWGGDKAKGVTHFEQAVKLHEQKECLQYDWEYLDTLAWLGKAYQANGNSEKAKLTYEKALEVEPSFRWVKNGLLPPLKTQ